MEKSCRRLAFDAREFAKNYNVNIALHTDHCPKDKLDSFVLPLLAASEAEVKAGRNPLFNSHVWDGSVETLPENLRVGSRLLERTVAAKIILEVEIGMVGVAKSTALKLRPKLYATVEDALATGGALGSGENGRYITALTFGNVHGVYKPGGVKAPPGDPEGHPGPGRRPHRQGQPVRPGVPRRFRLLGPGNRRRCVLRHDQDEH